MTPLLLRIKPLREAAGLSQGELADRIGTRRETLNRLERGKSGRIELELLDKLAHALGVAPGELFERRTVRKAADRKRR